MNGSTQARIDKQITAFDQRKKEPEYMKMMICGKEEKWTQEEDSNLCLSSLKGNVAFSNFEEPRKTIQVSQIELDELSQLVKDNEIQQKGEIVMHKLLKTENVCVKKQEDYLFRD